jgi:branched-chain amino acid transport system permease protein
LFLIALGPVVLVLLWLRLRARVSTLVRAAETADGGRPGVNQAWLFTSVFALGCSRRHRRRGASRASRRCGPGPAILSDVFVWWWWAAWAASALLAAVLIGVIKAFCIGIGNVSLLGSTSPSADAGGQFIVMAVVLVFRPGDCSAGGRA